jgi:hypothetical protein
LPFSLSAGNDLHHSPFVFSGYHGVLYACDTDSHDLLHGSTIPLHTETIYGIL